MVGKRIVVCVATGNQGGAVAAALLRKGCYVVALTRDLTSAPAAALAAQGAEVIQADPLSLGSLVDAFKGADGVFALTQPWSYETGRFDRIAEIRQGKNIIWACKASGIRHVIFSSVLNIGGRPSGVSWIDSKITLEEPFRDHLPGTVVVQPALYMEHIGTDLVTFAGERIRGRFSGDRQIPYVALRDIGHVVAGLFNDTDAYAGQKVMLAGDVMSGNEIARLLTDLSGDKIFSYRSVSELLLRMFHVGKYRMRGFFEEQGKLLQDMGELPNPLAVMPAEPLTVAEYLLTMIAE